MDELQKLRGEIDEIDEEIIALFEKRMDCSKAVGAYKKERNISVLNREREDEILNKAEQRCPKYAQSARLLYSDIMGISRVLQHNITDSAKELRNAVDNCQSELPQKNISVATQGIRGSNSHIASQSLFPCCQPKFLASFSDVFDAVNSGEADFGVLPVENSSAGSVADVYDLLLRHRFYIVSATAMSINHCLCALKQSTISDIEQVWSHPQGLAQCSNFISEHGYKEMAYANTAVAAKEVFEQKRLNCAAICSHLAADEYSLQVLDDNIQNYDGNTTRFVVISKKLYIPENANKISLCFNVPHKRGALAQVLSMFSLLGLNLTKIESRPMPNADFDYLFYLDFTGNMRDKSVMDFICSLYDELDEFSFIGNYHEE